MMSRLLYSWNLGDQLGTYCDCLFAKVFITMAFRNQIKIIWCQIPITAMTSRSMIVSSSIWVHRTWRRYYRLVSTAYLEDLSIH